MHQCSLYFYSNQNKTDNKKPIANQFLVFFLLFKGYFDLNCLNNHSSSTSQQPIDCNHSFASNLILSMSNLHFNNFTTLLIN